MTAPGAAALETGLAALGCPLSPTARERLLAYRDELARWGRVHNLTAVVEPEQMVPVHLLDSLALAPLLPAGPLVDIGSGGGLPGVPLAIQAPERGVTLVEPRAKRALFLEHVTRMLGLDHVRVERCRVEALPAANTGAFAAVVARAFGSLAQFVASSGHLVAADGALVAAKGRDPAAEVDALPAGWRGHSHALAVPALDHARHAVVIERTASTAVAAGAGG